MSTSKLCTVEVKKHNCLEVTPLEPKKDKKESFVQNKTTIWELLGKQTVQYHDGEGMKVMILPSKETNYYPLTINNEELERLKAKAVFLTEKERLQILEDARNQQTRLEQESAMRKYELKQYSKKGEVGNQGRLSGLESEAREKAGYFLKRAWELRKEEEDEVKRANSLILQTKCQAIRDAQLLEHKLIQREIRDEEKRLERMMEDESGRQLERERTRLQEERLKKKTYIMQLNQQMEEVRALRLLEAEFTIEERRKANEASFVMMLDELEELRRKKEEKRRAREALNLANDEILRIQAIEREEERIAEIRMKEYIKEKAEREERQEREKAAERRKRDLEYNRQRSIQEKQADFQLVQNEMNTVRRSEEYERQWRRREMEAAKKKQKMDEECKLAREQQIKDNRRYQAIQLAKEKRDYERNLKVQLELQERERLLEVKKRHEAELYRAQILKQINEKEKERIQERQEKFNEGLGLKAEEAKRKCELKMVFEKKVETLRQHNVPSVYISQIQRQLNIP